MNEISLICFIRACELHNLSKAAQELHISQPALSRRIIALEEEIGISLLKRSNTGVELTDGGKLFYKEVKKLVSAEQELREKMKVYQRSLLGSVTIGCDSRDYVELLVRAAKLLKKQQPGIEVEFKDMPHDHAIYHYLQENIDIACVCKCDVPELRESATEVIAKNQAVVLVPYGHRLWDLHEVFLRDLSGETIVFSDVENKAANGFKMAFEQNGMEWESVLICESHVTGMFKILSAGYVGIGGIYSAEQARTFEGEIRAIPIIDVALEDMDYCVIYQPSNANAARFMRCLAEICEEEA